MKKMLFLFAATFLPPLNGYSDNGQAKPIKVDSAKERYIRQVMEVTGVKGMTEQALDALVISLQRENPRIKKGYWVEFRKELDGDELIKRMVPVYDKYFSAEELKGIVEFYTSPVGQKVISTLPKLTQDCWAISQTWGKEQQAKFNAKVFKTQKK